jgi:hypothetical protein
MSLQKDPDLADRLRPLFERLREAEAERVPPLARVLERSSGRPRLVATRTLLRRLLAVSAGLALVLLATWWITPARVPEPRVARADVALLYWSSPTEALLTSQRDCMSDAYQEAVAAASRGKAE